MSGMADDPMSEVIRKSAYPDPTGGYLLSMDLRRGQTVLFAPINRTSTGEIVAAVAGKKIKVLYYLMVAAEAVAVKWQSNDTDLTGPMSFSAGGGVATAVGSPSMCWVLETAVNQPLKLNLSASVQVSGNIAYFLEA